MSAARLQVARLCLLLVVQAAVGEAKQRQPVRRYIKCGVNATAGECSVTQTLTDEARSARLLSEGAQALCPAGEYRQSQNAVVMPCAPTQARVDFNSPATATELEIVEVPVGTKNLKIEIHANKDVDTRIYDSMTNECIIGFSCHPCDENGCQDEDYHGVSLTFSGDRFRADDTGTDETVQIVGSTTRPLKIAMEAYVTTSGHVEITDEGVEPCEENPVPPGCRLCGTYKECTVPEVPQCDGTHIVSCGAEESMPASEALAMQAGAAAANEDEGLRLFDGTLGARVSQQAGDPAPQPAPMVAAAVVTAVAAAASLAAGLFVAVAAVRRQGWTTSHGGASEGSPPRVLISTEEEWNEQGAQGQEQEDLMVQQAQP